MFRGVARARGHGQHPEGLSDRGGVRDRLSMARQRPAELQRAGAAHASGGQLLQHSLSWSPLESQPGASQVRFERSGRGRSG